MKVWHVNTTSRGGGVAEVLDALCRFPQGTSPLVHRRFVTGRDAKLFTATKRLHHRLHGVHRGELPDAYEHALFLAFAEHNATRLLERIGSDDSVLLHDPQTLPIAPLLAAEGCRVFWRCHIGTWTANAVTKETWRYLSQFWPRDITLIFSHRSLVPVEATGFHVEIVPPSIDPISVKNRHMGAGEIKDVLTSAGLLGRASAGPGRQHVLYSEGVLGKDPLVLQVSRWDPLKDMGGVLRAFASSSLVRSAQLVLCGPSPQSVTDDPEARAVLEAVVTQWQNLPSAVRRRAHLVCTTLDDDEGNARLVNALQRRAAVVTQRSVQEGFGLTVTEAMLKARPVVASNVGGIPTQITHDKTGLLLNRPCDDDEFVAAVTRLLRDEARASALGRAAASHTSRHFITAREAADHQRILASPVPPPMVGCLD